MGQYVANAILFFCHNIPQPLLDVNMARILERYYGPRKLSDIRFDPYLQDLSAEITNQKDSATINWAILDLASFICKPNHPKCNICIVTWACDISLSIQCNLKKSLMETRMHLQICT